MKMYNICVLLTLVLSLKCSSTLQFGEYDNYWDWFIGGYYMNMSNIPPNHCPQITGSDTCTTTLAADLFDNYISRSNYVHHVIDKRHPYYLWLRTPELIYNPQGGWHYPVVVMVRNYSYQKRSKDKFKLKIYDQKCGCHKYMYYHCIKGPVYYKRGDRIPKYGLIDYAAYFIDKDLVDDVNHETRWILSPFFYFAIIVAKTMQLPFYLAHDVIKIPLMPIAAIH